METNNGRTAQYYTKIDRGSSEQAGERRGQPILVETHAESGYILIDCQLQTSRQNSQQSQERQRATAKKPVRRRRRKNRSPSALARSRKRHARFLEKKLAGKPDLASPEEDQQNSDINPVYVKELENTSLACGSNRDLVSSENPAPSPASDPDLLSVSEQAILCEFLDTIDSDDSDN